MNAPKHTDAAVRDRCYNLLKYPWHTGHDYELCRLPHRMHLLGCTHRKWSTGVRPLPESVRVIHHMNEIQADVMILHVDQWTWHEVDKRLLFLRYRSDFRGPKIIINHGCNVLDGCSSEQMRELVGDNFMVCNSATAKKLWGVERSRYVRHGMLPEDWPQTNYGRGNIVAVQPNAETHAECRNGAAILAFEKAKKIQVEWVGRDRSFDSFEKYRVFISSSSIFFNPSYASANPRARTEAMLSGLVVVTTNHHGEGDYIVNGENGFASNNMKELYEYLEHLHHNPEETQRIGQAGRRTAQQIFHVDRFLDEWCQILDEVVAAG